MPSLHYFYQNYGFETQKTDVLGNKSVIFSLVSWWISSGDTVFEPQSEATEEDNSKWGRDKQSKYKIGNASFKRKPTKYLRGRGRNFIYSSLSFTWCPTADAGVLLCNVQRQFRIWMCMQCLHKGIHSNNNRCLVYTVKYQNYQNIKTVSTQSTTI